MNILGALYSNAERTRIGTRGAKCRLALKGTEAVRRCVDLNTNDTLHQDYSSSFRPLTLLATHFLLATHY